MLPFCVLPSCVLSSRSSPPSRVLLWRHHTYVLSSRVLPPRVLCSHVLPFRVLPSGVLSSHVPPSHELSSYAFLSRVLSCCVLPSHYFPPVYFPHMYFPFSCYEVPRMQKWRALLLSKELTKVVSFLFWLLIPERSKYSSIRVSLTTRNSAFLNLLCPDSFSFISLVHFGGYRDLTCDFTARVSPWYCRCLLSSSLLLLWRFPNTIQSTNPLLFFLKSSVSLSCFCRSERLARAIHKYSTPPSLPPPPPPPFPTPPSPYPRP